MDSFTLNKVAGAVLGTCLVGMAIQIVAEGIYEPGPPSKPGYELPNPKPESAAGGEKKPEVAPIAVRLAKADPKKGEADAKVCSACHNFEEGAGAKVGPDLYSVVDRPKGKQPGFDYSAGMKAKGGNWTYADLDDFITKPSAYVQGTKMGYPGQENPEKRAEIIAYLRSLSKSPVALPPVTDADKKEEASAASGGKTAEPAKPAGTQASSDADLLKLVGAADPKKGQSDAQICSACHILKKGGGVLVGPPLWDVVDRKKGSVPGFDYSAGLKAKGGTWTIEDLNTWLTKPSAYVPDTKMGYPGESDPKKRAQIIAYLRTLSDQPPALPTADEGAKKPAEPAAGEAKNTPPAAAPAPSAPASPPPPAATPAPPAPDKGDAK